METRNLELIGKGLFSKVYKLNEKTVLIKSLCYAKECLALFIEGSMFPKIEKIDYQLYTCEYYPKVTSLKDSLKPSEYKIYQELRRLSWSFFEGRNNPYEFWRKQFETITNKRFRDNLINAIDELVNYGHDVFFEISPRNVAVKNGKLILLDCFFFTKQANDVRTKKIKL